MTKPKTEIKNLILKHQKKLRLDLWNITFDFSETEGNGRQACEILITQAYYQAHITIYPWGLKNMNEMDHMIKHELCHIITEPLYYFCIDLLNSKLRTFDQIEHERERMTEHIARII